MSGYPVVAISLWSVCLKLFTKLLVRICNYVTDSSSVTNLYITGRNVFDW